MKLSMQKHVKPTKVNNKYTKAQWQPMNSNV